MIAVVSPGPGDQVDAAQHRRLGARVAELDAAQLQHAVPAQRGDAARPAARTRDSVSSTSSMRSAQTSARGTIMNMKVAIITDIRICIR